VQLIIFYLHLMLYICTGICDMTGNLENFLHFEQGAGLGGTQAAAAVRQILQWIDCSLPAAIPFPPLLLLT
jgi:hypothetical protein